MVATHARNRPRPKSDSSCWPNNQKNTMPSSGQICGSVANGHVKSRQISNSRTRAGTKTSLLKRSTPEPVHEHRRQAEHAHDVGGGDVVPSGAKPPVVRSTAEDSGELLGHRASRYPAVRMLDTSCRGSSPASFPADGEASARRHDPGVTGLLPVQGCRRPGHLRRQGVEPASAPVELLPVAAQPPSAHGPDGRDRRVGRVDDRAQRGRGADARVLLDQGASAAVQRPATRRQELPVPRRHRRRPVAAGDGHARSKAQGHPLLRPVRPRLRHPRHPRPLVEVVPDPHLQSGQVQPARTARAPVPAVPHREVRRPVRRRDRGDAVPRAGERTLCVPRRRHRRDRGSPRSRHAVRGERSGVRARGPPA